MANAQTKSDLLIRISEIEVYPEHLTEYLNFAKDVGATSVKVESGVVCIYPMVQQRDSCQIRILEIYRDMDRIQEPYPNPAFPNLQARHAAHGEEA